jgi:hypothetical protein
MPNSGKPAHGPHHPEHHRPSLTAGLKLPDEKHAGHGRAHAHERLDPEALGRRRPKTRDEARSARLMVGLSALGLIAAIALALHFAGAIQLWPRALPPNLGNPGVIDPGVAASSRPTQTFSGDLPPPAPPRPVAENEPEHPNRRVAPLRR